MDEQLAAAGRPGLRPLALVRFVLYAAVTVAALALAASCTMVDTAQESLAREYARTVAERRACDLAGGVQLRDAWNRTVCVRLQRVGPMAGPLADDST